jgi:hypothetical protein
MAVYRCTAEVRRGYTRRPFCLTVGDVPAFGKVEGTYQRSQGARRVYTYTATYATTNGSIEWGATVVFQDSVKGRPQAILYQPRDMTDLAAVVRLAVETSIEGLIDVEE